MITQFITVLKITLDATREELVDERAFHINVAEDDTVESVVEHHIKPPIAAISGIHKPEQ